MRRRTKKLSSNKGLIYIVLLALLAGGRYIYNNYLAPDEVGGAATLTEPATSAGQEATSESEAPRKHKGIDRSGWAELPAEINDKDLYYAYHTMAEIDAKDPRRNYAVCFSRELRCPVWVAAALHPSFTGEVKRNDSYQPDPQLPVNIQPQLSRSYGGEYSRGHMLGSAERTSTRAANDQTFYATNIAPQLRDGFNARGGAWNNMEAFVDRQVCRDTLYVVTGCLFTEYTDTTRLCCAPVAEERARA